MTAAHVCDECKRVAPLDEALGWWSVEAMDGLGGVRVLANFEKPEYEFCFWDCLRIFADRMALVTTGAA